MPKLKKKNNSYSEIETMSQVQDCHEEKPFSKIDYRDKLHIIAAVDKGQTKVDIGREFGINPRAVTYIYKQKDAVFKKCRQRFSFDADTTDLWQCLLDWFISRTNNNLVVLESDFKAKAEELAHSTNSNFKFTDEWFRKFRISNTIIKHKHKIHTSLGLKEFKQWMNILADMKEDDVYVAGTCSLLYMDDLQTFTANNLNYQNCISLLLRTNMTGSDKQDLMVAGNAITHSGIQSLPVQYFHKENAKFDNCMFKTILKYWDETLKTEDRKILLALLVPDSYIDGLDLQYIKILRCTDFPFTTKTFERLINCFKYHYRKLQITQELHYRSERDFIDNIHLMTLAWHNVSANTITQIFHPRFPGCYYFNNLKKSNEINEENDRFSLSQWSSTYGIPLNLEDSILDNFITCDNDIVSVDNYLETSEFINMNDWFAQIDYSPSFASVEAYQAVKRLLSYMQSQNAPEVIENLRVLEEQFEFDASTELLQNIEADDINHADR